MKPTLAALAAIGLTGCVMTTTEPAPPPVADINCDIDALAGLVGQPASTELAADAIAKAGARTVRWIGPGMAVTMDYRPDRLNIELDGSNRVTKFSCG
jgi:hypothetical protein